VVWVPSTYYVAWWNLENLFDEENSPRRSEQLQRAFGADLAGWTPARRDRKVAQLASAIAQMNGGAGLDLLEICEVENRLVVDLLVRALDARLPGCNYAVVHADTDDARGIDVAFIYDSGLLQAPDDQVFFHVVLLATQPANSSRSTSRRTRIAPGRWSETTGPRAVAASLSPPATETSRARCSATSTSARSRSTARTRRL
jgi:hypothetical protein